MATTLFLKNGKTRLIFDDKSHTEFARVLEEELGRDAERHYMRLVRDAPRPDGGSEIETNKIRNLRAQIETLDSDLEDAEDWGRKLSDRLRDAGNDARAIADGIKDCIMAAERGDIDTDRLENLLGMTNRLLEVLE